MLKAFDEIVLRDPIWRHYVVAHTDGWREKTIADAYSEAAELELTLEAPEQIREVFDTARHLLIYSWFAHRLLPVAEMQAVAALELALRVRLGDDGAGRRKRTLRPLLREALRRGLIDADRLRSFRTRAEQRTRFADRPDLVAALKLDQTANEFVRALCDSIPDLRNLLAHGDPYLSPFARRTVGISCDLINQLFDSASVGR